MENGLEDVPCINLTAADLADPSRLKIDKRMLRKLREVQAKIQNHHKMERMKVTVKRKTSVRAASAVTRMGA